MVVIDREDYISKVQELLAQPAYKLIPRDPTNIVKSQLITKLRKIKKDGNLDEGTYKAMYPTGCIPPKFYGLPKIHKTGNPLRPIVSSRGSVTYQVAKVLSKVLKPLVGKSPHHIKSTCDFLLKAKGITLQLGEFLYYGTWYLMHLAQLGHLHSCGIHYECLDWKQFSFHPFSVEYHRFNLSSLACMLNNLR